MSHSPLSTFTSDNYRIQSHTDVHKSIISCTEALDKVWYLVKWQAITGSYCLSRVSV